MTIEMQGTLWQWVSCLVWWVGITLCTVWCLWQVARQHRGLLSLLGHFNAYLYQVLAQSSAAHKHLCLSCRWGGVKIWVLIDSGATHSLTSLAHVQACGIVTCKRSDFHIRLPDGSLYSGCEHVKCHLKTCGLTIATKLLVVDLDLGYPVILGIDWLTTVNPKIDWVARTLCIEGTVVQGVTSDECTQMRAAQQLVDEVYCLSYQQAKRAFRHRDQIYFCYSVQAEQAPSSSLEDCIEEDFAPVDSMLSTQCPSNVDSDFVKLMCGQPQIDALLQEYQDLFMEPEGLPPHRPVELHIDLVPGAVPPHRPAYKMGPSELQELKRQLDVLLRKGYIQPSTSPYAAPLFFVKKKDGSLRPVCDWRLLNAVTIKARGPIPIIGQLLDAMQGSTVWSRFDCLAAFNQMRIVDSDVHRSSFVCRYGQFEWRVAAFGLCNMPAVWQNLMHYIFRDYLDDFVEVYLDDIVVHSASMVDHVRHLRLVFAKLREHKLYLKAKKCQLAQPEIEFLGHIISRAGVHLDPIKVKSIQEWPVPKDAHQVRQFLGLCGWFRRHIKGFSSIASPLHTLTGVEKAYVWGDQEQLAFDALKQAVLTAPVLKLYDAKAETMLHTDASDLGLGAVLLQRDSSGDASWHPVAFHSRKFSAAEKNYAIHERELLAVVDSVKAWQHYLQHVSVLVKVDHEALKWFWAQPKLSPRQARWVTLLQGYDLRIEYQKGCLNVVADALSRRPDFALCASVVFESSWLDLVKVAAKQDMKYQLMLQTCLAGRLVSHEVQDGLLYERQQTRHRLVVPANSDLKQTLMFEAHDPPSAGHRGFAKTLARLSQFYVWKGMATDVQRYCSACPICIAQKGSTQSPLGKLQPLPIPKQKWTDISLDFIVALPPAHTGCDTCLVVTDRLTKMVVCCATKGTATAPQIADLFLKSVFRRFGLPHCMVSDRDPKFVSMFWKSLFALLHTRLCFSSAYHPQSDGATERMNKSLEHILRCYAVASDPSSWEDRLPCLEFAVNSAVNVSTGYSPFYLMYGYLPRDPLGLLSDVSLAGIAVESTRAMLQRMRSDLLCAQRSVAVAQQLQAKYADKHRRPYQFAVGDFVMLSTEHLSAYQHISKKLRARWCGPFRVIQLVTPVAIKLDLPTSIRIHPVVHAEWLKPVAPSVAARGAFELPEDPTDQELIPVSEVDLVLGQEVRHGHTYYLVRWKGLPSWDVTWHTRAQILAIDPSANAKLHLFDALHSRGENA